MGKSNQHLLHPEAPGPSPYATVEEIRRNPRLVDQIGESGTAGGPRFAHATDLELFAKYVPDRNAKILDCGVIHGEFLEYLHEQGYTHVSGLDFVDMRKKGKEVGDFHTLDFNTDKIPYADETLDVVTAWGFPEHLENPYHFLREVHRVLKPGGLYLATWANIEHLMTRLVFLKRAEMRNYERHNSHIAVYPRGVFEKTYLRYFTLVEKTYSNDGAIIFPPFWLSQFISRFLPKRTSLTSHHVMYVLKKKPFIPYA